MKGKRREKSWKEELTKFETKWLDMKDREEEGISDDFWVLNLDNPWIVKTVVPSSVVDEIDIQEWAAESAA